jgi:serine/threonine protein kinase
MARSHPARRREPICCRVVARTPTRIGRYDLIAALATGGMGRTYLARARGLGGFARKVVIKTLEVPDTAESEASIAMFLDEARLLGVLHHQHIASVFEVDRDGDRHFMVLDYVEGGSAHDAWERAQQLGAALPLDFVLTVVSAAANGLHYAHTRKDDAGAPLGIVHRDVSPSNVMLGHDGAIKLIDFGIAMSADRKTKTQTGYVKGKVGYLSPEQVSGRDVDRRTDVFALGILLYELSTLSRAFRDSSDLATMQRIKLGKVVPPSQLITDYPPELEAIVLRALQVDPRARFPDADAMRRAIEALGHRMHFVLGDAAVIEVMAQLFDASAGARPPSLDDDAALEWASPDHALTVRRDPRELLDAMRADTRAQPPLAKPGVPPPPSPGAGRRLRAATESVETFTGDGDLSGEVRTTVRNSGERGDDTAPDGRPRAVVDAEKLANDSVDITLDTPVRIPARKTATIAAASPSASAPSLPVASTLAERAELAADPAVAAAAHVPMFGAHLIEKRRTSRARWIAIGGSGAAVLACVLFVATRKSSDVAPSAPAKPAPVAARTPPSPPPLPTTAPAATVAVPSKVRIRLVTHPADATVLLDGKKIGHTPYDDTLPADPGKHTIKLRRRGYVTQSLDVGLDGDVAEELNLALQPQR